MQQGEKAADRKEAAVSRVWACGSQIHKKPLCQNNSMWKGWLRSLLKACSPNTHCFEKSFWASQCTWGWGFASCPPRHLFLSWNCCSAETGDTGVWRRSEYPNMAANHFAPVPKIDPKQTRKLTHACSLTSTFTSGQIWSTERLL
jgi:hypothetical protein